MIFDAGSEVARLPAANAYCCTTVPAVAASSMAHSCHVASRPGTPPWTKPSTATLENTAW